jgi:sugar phosphate isomerase/epimerase
MKLGAGTVTWAFRGESLETALSEIATTGIKHIDLLGMLHGDPDNLTPGIKARAKKIIDEEGLSIASILAVKPGTNIAAQDPAVILNGKDYFKRILDLCAFFGAREICFMAGHHEIESDVPSSWSRAVAFSRWIAEACVTADVYATYELEWRTYGLVRSVVDMKRMIEDVAHPRVYANIDVGHAGLARDSLAEMQKIGAHTLHLHLNDNDTVIHTNALPGQGEVPITDYVRALIDGGMLEQAEAMGRTVVAGIEVEDVAGSGQPSLVLIEKSRDWIIRNIPAVEL